jgi:LysR family nitrogen assimilation transcriptional regulator
MELRQIRYFVAVAETKSLKSAVERLHIAQPALSQSIKLLEEELGSELFVRSRRGMELTSAGHKFLDSSKLILREVERARERVIEEEDNPSGEVYLALPPSVSSVLSVPLFREVRRRYPNVILHIEEQTRLNLQQVFSSGTLDLALYFHGDELEGVVHQALVDEEMYLVTRYIEGSELPPEIDFSKLTDYPMVFPRVGTLASRNVASLATELKLDIPILPNRISPSILIELVQQGLTNSVVPWTLATEGVKRKRLSAARVVNPAVTRRINLAYPSNRHVSNATIVVIKSIKKLTKKLNAEDKWRGELLLDANKR